MARHSRTLQEFFGLNVWNYEFGLKLKETMRIFYWASMNIQVILRFVVRRILKVYS